MSIVAGLGLTGNALAEAFKDKRGRVVFVPTSIEDANQADGSIVRKVSSTGISVADLPFPFDHMKSRCTGTLLIDADGKLGRSRGICEMLSSRGDRAVYTYVGDAGRGRGPRVDGNLAD